MDDLVITNAKIVMRGAVIDGSVVIRDGLLAEIVEGPSDAAGAIDF